VINFNDPLSITPIASFDKSAAAQERLHALVPGGAHTYARGADQYPEAMAPVVRRGRGARVEDLDGNVFVEYGMGLRSVTLGHGYEPVVEAAHRAALDGMSFSRPSQWEVDAAEQFLSDVPAAEMVKFAKNGSDATTAAVKVARAATGRKLVAICSTQPFFSTDDWFIGQTAMRAGIPPEHSSLTVRYPYNDLDAVEALIDQHPGQIACFILEAATALAEPDPGYLQGLQQRAHGAGALVIFDEMITGLRWSLGGAQHTYGVAPDLSTWGKALGNGYPLSALAGRRDLLEIGGLRTDRSRPFLLSTTHGPETSSLAAYLAVAKTYHDLDVVGWMERQGTKLASMVNASAESKGLQHHVRVIGRPSCLVFTTLDQSRSPSQEFRSLFLQEMLTRNVLGQSFVISAAHTDDDLEVTARAADAALEVYGRAVEQGSTSGLLRGRPVAPAIREYAEPRRVLSNGHAVADGKPMTTTTYVRSA
jgi:glutamate-1-semialdehyde 2,1-aminomutase